MLPYLMAIATLCSSARLLADEPGDEVFAGDTVVTVRDRVELGILGQAGVPLPAGQKIQVTEVRGEWVGGYAFVGREKQTGWVLRKDVRLADIASDSASPIIVDDKPDDPEAMQELKKLEVVLESNAAGHVVSADASAKPLSNDALIHFASLHHLATLQLANCGVGDDGLRHLTGLRGLQELYLDETQVTDAGLTHLSRLTNLEVLTLSGSKVVGVGLKSLQPLTHLRVLNLSRCPLADQALAPLGRLARLEVLALAETNVQSQSLIELKPLTRLRVLNLNDTDVTASGLEHLKTLDQLRMLYVRDTAITEVDTWTLTEANPSLAVYTE